MSIGNGLATKDQLIRWRGCWFLPDFFIRLVPAVLEYEADGSSITLNQGYRFLGVPADRKIGQGDHDPDVETNAWRTSTGDGNQYYQEGRADVGATPSAATPGQSNHGDPNIGAVDCNASNTARRQATFSKRGLRANIGGETWHWAAVDTPTVALPTLDEAKRLAGIINADSVSVTSKGTKKMATAPKLINGHGSGGRASIYAQYGDNDYFIPVDGGTAAEIAKDWAIDLTALPDHELQQIIWLNNAIETARLGVKPNIQP